MRVYVHEDLVDEIKLSFKEKPEVVIMSQVYDYKQWMCEQIPSMHDHLKAHQFKFQKDARGTVKMFYKEWSTDDYWLPQSGMYVLADTNIPHGIPDMVEVKYDQEKVQKIESTISKLTAYLEKSGALEWWANFIATMKRDIPCGESDSECKLYDYRCMSNLIGQ